MDPKTSKIGSEGSRQRLCLPRAGSLDALQAPYGPLKRLGTRKWTEIDPRQAPKRPQWTKITPKGPEKWAENVLDKKLTVLLAPDLIHC